MFTIGIFSTHLPYVAFVFFYALFFLFGIRDHSAAGPAGKDKKICIEIMADAAAPSDVQKSAMDGMDDLWNDSGETADISRFDFKTLLFYPRDEQAKSCLYCFSLYSRPPPLA